MELTAAPEGEPVVGDISRERVTEPQAGLAVVVEERGEFAAGGGIEIDAFVLDELAQRLETEAAPEHTGVAEHAAGQGRERVDAGAHDRRQGVGEALRAARFPHDPHRLFEEERVPPRTCDQSRDLVRAQRCGFGGCDDELLRFVGAQRRQFDLRCAGG